MIEVFPSYYYKFKCVADKCKNSCCIGWEIDIDEETMEIYKEIDGEIGETIRNNICGNPPHFILKNNRCPFLNNEGLCDIISHFGEEGLCDICYLHPRFQNEYESFVETGLGLCCEEASRIILSEKEKFFVEKAENSITKNEKSFLEERSRVFSVLQNREKTILERLELLAKEYGLKFEFEIENVKKKYLELERLDERWTEELKSVSDGVFEEFGIPSEQLAVYFVFRHFRGTDKKKEIYFVLISTYIVSVLWKKHKDEGFEKLTDIARMYSQEVEYCIPNMEKIMKGI